MTPQPAIFTRMNIYIYIYILRSCSDGVACRGLGEKRRVLRIDSRSDGNASITVYLLVGRNNKTPGVRTRSEDQMPADGIARRSVSRVPTMRCGKKSWWTESGPQHGRTGGRLTSSHTQAAPWSEDQRFADYSRTVLKPRKKQNK